MQYKFIEGWWNYELLINYKEPIKTIKLNLSTWYNIETINENTILFKCLQIIDKKNLEKIPNASVNDINYTTKCQCKHKQSDSKCKCQCGYSIALQGAVITNKEGILHVVDYDDNSFTDFTTISEDYMEGNTKETALPSQTGGNIGFYQGKKGEIPDDFKNKDFNKIYKKIYNQGIKNDKK